MKTTILLVDVTSPWVWREDVEVDRKLDAWHAGYQLAEKWGLKAIRSHQTTVLYTHFVTVWVGRRFMIEKLILVALAGNFVGPL